MENRILEARVENNGFNKSSPHAVGMEQFRSRTGEGVVSARPIRRGL